MFLAELSPDQAAEVNEAGRAWRDAHAELRAAQEEMNGLGPRINDGRATRKDFFALSDKVRLLKRRLAQAELAWHETWTNLV
jgi:hypothetical protein